jgi:FG-GAP repeat
MSGRRRAHVRSVTLAAAIAAASTVLLPGAAAHAAPQTRQLVDFDGDGHADLAVGAPDGTVGGHARAGYVSVVYGATGGVDPARHADISQNTAGVPGAAEAADTFGSKVVPADLNGDGYTDLLVGADGEDVGTAYNAGMITVLWGGPKGLAAGTAIDTGATPDLSVGRTFAAGDFDGDGRQDIAYPAGSDLDVLSDVGTDGRAAAHAAVDTSQLLGSPTFLGDSVAAGDVNGDGIGDLVVTGYGSDDEDASGTALWLGGAHGDLTAGGLGFTRMVLEAKGYWLGGVSAAIGDVNGDGYGDIVVGHTHEGFRSDSYLPVKGGAVGVAYGGPAGQSTTVTPVWINQDTAGVPGVAETNDQLGADVAVGDVNGDGYADVVAGVPGEDFDALTDPGSFLLVKGSSKGLTGAGAEVFGQNSAGLPGVSESGDRFGTSVAILGATGTDRAQVAVSASNENAGNGAVWVLRGAAAGLTGTHTANFGAATMGAPVTKADFGASLSEQ